MALKKILGLVFLVPNLAEVVQLTCDDEKLIVNGEDFSNGDSLSLVSYGLDSRETCSYWKKDCCIGLVCEPEQLCPDEKNKNVLIYNKQTNNDELGNRCVLEIANFSFKDFGRYVARRGGKATDDPLASCYVYNPKTRPSFTITGLEPWFWVTLVLSALFWMTVGAALWEWKVREAFIAWKQR